VDGLGHELLAGAALAHHEHRALGGGHLADELEDLLHPGGLAHYGLERVLPLEALAQVEVLQDQRPLLQAVLDLQEQLVVLERLGDEAVGAVAGGGDGALDGAVGGDHDEHRLGIEQPDLVEHLHAVQFGHHQIDQDQVVGVGRKFLQAFPSVHGAVQDVALLAQERAQDVVHDGLVVDEQNPLLVRALFGRHELDASFAAGSAAGSLMVNRVP